MDRTILLTELRSAIKSIGREDWQIEFREDCPSSDVVLHTNHCVVFFVLIPSSSQIISVHKKAQNEIAALSQRQKASWPRDNNLVFLITDTDFPPMACANARKVVEDRYYCRKFVLHLNGKSLSELLCALPFWPLTPSFHTADISVSFSVKGLLKEFDPELTSDLAAMHPGVDRIAENIVAGKYQLIDQSSSGRKFIARERNELPGIRVTGLDILDFRGIGLIDQKVMPLTSDITIIYGPNGTGKTSIADALEWVVTGNISHVETNRQSCDEPDPIVNLFSTGSTTKVTCHLNNNSSVTRKKDGRKEIRQINGVQSPDDRKIIDHVVGTRVPKGVTPLPIQHLRELFSGTHLLAQHNMRKFLEKTKAAERFDILTKMIGAEEFVRFRDKASSVSKRLEIYLRDLTYESERISSEFKDLKNKVTQSRVEVKDIQNVLSKDRTAIKRIQELIEILEQIGCVFDKELLGCLHKENLDNYIDGIVSYLEPIIESKNKQISELLFKLDNIKQLITPKLKVREEIEELRREISHHNEMISKLQKDHTELIKELKPHVEHREILYKESSEAEFKNKQLLWLSSYYGEYTQLIEQIKENKIKLSNCLAVICKYEKEFHQNEDVLGTILSSLKRTEQNIIGQKEKLSSLNILANRLEEVIINHNKTKHLKENITSISQKIKELQAKLDTAKMQTKGANSLTNNLRGIYEKLSSGHETRHTILARLYELTDLPKCSLCGREFSSIDEAKSTIKQQLFSIPDELADITHRYEKAKKDEGIAIEKEQTIIQELKRTESSLDDHNKQLSAILSKIHGYILECKNISIILPEDNPESWTNIIAESFKIYQVDKLVSEITYLKDQNATVMAQIEKIKQMISTENEGARKIRLEEERLKTRIVNIQTEMMANKIDPQKLPTMKCLSEEIASVKKQLVALNNQLSSQDEQIKPLVTKDKDLKDKITTINEQITCGKKRLNECESIWIEFTSLCQMADVEVNDVHKSIQKRIQAVYDMKVSLGEASNIYLELQQYASLERKYSELHNYLQKQEQLEKELKGKQNKADYLKKWHDRLKILETEVSKQQVSTVGAHLKQLEPTLQLLYTRLNPHPVFGGVKVAVSEENHTLDIHSMTSDEADIKPTIISPSKFFSDAQLNVLAISIFLAGALQQQWSRFRTLIIDDPIQQMDEMNVAAFLDLVRGLAGTYQFIIFTCSRDFYLLALDKLACMNAASSKCFNAYRLEGMAPAKLAVHCDTNTIPKDTSNNIDQIHT